MVSYVTGLQSKLNILILEVDRFTAIQWVHMGIVKIVNMNYEC